MADTGLRLPWRTAGWLAVAYVAAALLSLWIGGQPGSVATIWYANAVAIAVIARHAGQPAALLVGTTAVSIVGANLLFGNDWAAALRFVPANLVEVGLGAWGLRRAGLEGGLRSPRQMLRLLVLGALLPQGVAALCAAWVVDPALGTPMRIALAWFEGAVIGALTMLPLAHVLTDPGEPQRWRRLLDLRVPAALLGSVGLSVLVLAYLPFPFVYVVLPMLLAAMTLDLAGAALVGMAVSMTVSLMLGLGVLVTPPLQAVWQEALVYLAQAAALLPALLLAAARAELRDSHARLARRSEELRVANERLEQFVRIASHDLREPLNTVVSFAMLLDEDHGAALPPQAREWLALVRRGGDHMRLLLDDVLGYVRARHELQEPATPVALEPVFAVLRETLAARLRDSGGELQVQAPLPAVRGHAALLTLLFQNLLGNALKFASPQRPPRVCVEGRVEGGEACIVVADNGIGIAEADLGRLFQPFQRLHTRRQYEGSGLGLALCREIAQAHGGSIEVRSRPGEGSRFEVRLPLA